MDHEQFKREYEADQERRKNDPEKYPWFEYRAYGWHAMSFISDEELAEAIEFYRLYPDGKGGYLRRGRQPIYVTPRRKEHEVSGHPQESVDE